MRLISPSQPVAGRAAFQPSEVPVVNETVRAVLPFSAHPSLSGVQNPKRLHLGVVAQWIRGLQHRAKLSPTSSAAVAEAGPKTLAGCGLPRVPARPSSLGSPDRPCRAGCLEGTQRGWAPACAVFLSLLACQASAASAVKVLSAAPGQVPAASPRMVLPFGAPPNPVPDPHQAGVK